MSSPHQETCTNGDVRMLTLYLHLLLNTVEVLDAYLVRCDLSEAGGLRPETKHEMKVLSGDESLIFFPALNQSHE